MTTKLNDNPQDPMFQVHVNLWHSTLDSLLKQGAELPASIKAADEAVKAFKKRFIGPTFPQPTAEPVEPVYATQDPYPGSH